MGAVLRKSWMTVGVAAWLGAAGAGAACNRHDAEQAQKVLRQLATWKAGPMGVDFTWSPQAAAIGPTAQVSLVRMFIRSDSCLHGAARPIRFFQNRRLFGTSGIDGRFVPADPAFPMPAEPGWHAWFWFHPAH